MSTVAFYITYDDMPFIARSLESIKGKFDRVVAVDGKFHDFPSGHQFSMDGTLAALKDAGVEVHLFANKTEIAKRNLLFDFTDIGDTVLVLDADEIFSGKVPDLQTDIGIIKLFERFDGISSMFKMHNRFFKVKEGMHYKKAHHAIYDIKGNLYCDAERAYTFSISFVDDFYLGHERYGRSEERQKAKEKYYEILRENENPLNYGKLHEDAKP